MDTFAAAFFWFLKLTIKVTEHRTEDVGLSRYSVAKFNFVALTMTQSCLAVLCALALQRRSC